jgi:ribosomal protein S18 acetylase RimI-like enzyme
MDEIRGGRRAAMVRAVEENGAEFLLALGRAAGAEERAESAIQWVIGGSPIAYHNCVVRADLRPDAAEAAIAASVACFRAHGVPGSWHVGPSMRPADLGARLLAHGFVHEGDDIGMAADLTARREAMPQPPGLVVERVRDDAGLEAWANVLARSFGEGEPEADWVRGTFRRIGLGDDVSWRHYLGLLAGKPVATASLFVGGGAAGVYFVSTLPSARRQGIGAAVTLAALREGLALGQRVGVLGASQMAHAMYRRLGFEELCRIDLYEWRPAA